MGKFDGIFIASDMDGTLLDDTHDLLASCMYGSVRRLLS